MITNLVLYRNELKNKTIHTYKLLGILNELILSKEIFESLDEISMFIEKVYNLEVKYNSKDLYLKDINNLVINKNKFNKKEILNFINNKIKKYEYEYKSNNKKGYFNL